MKPPGSDSSTHEFPITHIGNVGSAQGALARQNDCVEDGQGCPSCEDVQVPDGPSQPQAPETSGSGPSEPTANDRMNKYGFFFFMAAFMIYMFIQAVFFPRGGTAPT